MGIGEWTGLIAVFVALVAMYRTFLTTSSFVPAKRATELSTIVIELRAEIVGLQAQVRELKNQVGDLMRENEFWRNQYRALKGDDRRSPPEMKKEP